MLPQWRNIKKKQNYKNRIEGLTKFLHWTNHFVVLLVNYAIK